MKSNIALKLIAVLLLTFCMNCNSKQESITKHIEYPSSVIDEACGLNHIEFDVEYLRPNEAYSTVFCPVYRSFIDTIYSPYFHTEFRNKLFTLTKWYKPNLEKMFWAQTFLLISQYSFTNLPDLVFLKYCRGRDMFYDLFVAYSISQKKTYILTNDYGCHLIENYNKLVDDYPEILDLDRACLAKLLISMYINCDVVFYLDDMDDLKLAYSFMNYDLGVLPSYLLLYTYKNRLYFDGLAEDTNLINHCNRIFEITPAYIDDIGILQDSIIHAGIEFGINENEKDGRQTIRLTCYIVRAHVFARYEVIFDSKGYLISIETNSGSI